MKKFFLLLLMQLAAAWAFGNPTDFSGSLKVSGRVTDSEGNPLVGATVALEGTLLGTSTNPDGSFVLNRLRPGTYVLIASFVGFETARLNLVLQENVVINITLKESTLMFDEVVVSATRASGRMPIAQTTISKEQIDGNNTGFDVPYLLELQPSVVATSEGGTGIGNTAIRIRGTDMSRINVTVNSVPLNDAESQGVFWVDLPDFTASVDNLQVQRGVGTSTNGAGAFGATINFQTVSLSQTPFTSFDIFAGSYNTWKLSARFGTGLVKEKFSFEGRYSQLGSDGYIDRAGSDHRSMFMTAAWHGAKSLIRVNIIHGEEHTGITWEGTPDYMLQINRRYNPAGEYTDEFGNTRYYKDQKDNYWQTHYQLISTFSLGSNLTLNATVHLTDGKGYYEEFKEDRKFSKYALPNLVLGIDTIRTSDIIQRKWMENQFYGAVASVNYRKKSLEVAVGGGWNRYDGDHFGRILWSAYNYGLPKDYEWYRNNGLKTDWNIFAKSVWQPGKMLSLFADIQLRGIQYDLKGPDSDLLPVDQEHSWHFVNPKIGTTFRFSPASELYVSFGVANREPSRSDLKDALKGATGFAPKPERLYDWELGYGLRHQDFAINTNIYYMKYRDQLVLTGELTDVGYALMDNVPDSYRAGVEILLGLKPFQWLNVEANTTFSRNIIEHYTNYVNLTDNPTDWNETGLTEAEYLGNTTISYSPSVVGSAKITVTPVKALYFSWIGKYVGKQYIDNTESSSRSLDAYFVNNIVGEYKFSPKMAKSISLQVVVNNLFNLKYEANAWVYRTKFQSGDPEYVSIGYYPQATRNFMLRLAVGF
ncbi:MAG TPA: TonB-dependent receptor [Tenuifilaceae bacterium]|nr:TonB-dependent receptor [Bacteroidales bacterium]HOA08697.1 TonB-dependent receptor [Tenuifilaceae bacterium]HOC35467.1 TonB-dependent receptor [Tenuifilaceae bacterium]HOG71200.1 TonB-dependent receptor [Tenuifilaceae bacterium]HQM04211.1 TonB-dependent receptor [Tenuifilaceae bacterium]